MADAREAHAGLAETSGANGDERPAPGLAKAAAPPSEPPAVMTVEELAALMRVRPKTVYAAIRRREIPGIVRVGRVIRVSRPAVLAWLAGQAREVRSRRLP